MKKSQRMKTVQAIADREEEAQAQLLARLQLKVEQQQQKLAELRQYHKEYSQAATVDRRCNVDLNFLQENRRFLQNLSNAIQSQQFAVKDAELAVKKQRQRWIQARSQSMSRNALTERYLDAERREQDRIEQKVMDDMNNQRFVWQHSHA
ncbi:flagellar export protein FliJ [Spongiibacter sp. KMU-158]|uniref:Flagellar FliJ protein n=1 Tax=Spongiibacter pelagi TaxID=2760804 RepID=A0A927GV96_9GAMM|nr:flagellar export protein FliJ [Spongiibacter pelagi]MBD2858436.1 flagellar export protein FliJ [Spongiibacter pelagi]